VILQRILRFVLRNQGGRTLSGNHAPLRLALALGNVQIGLGLRYSELIGDRIDLEEQIALGHASVSATAISRNAAAHRRCNMHDVSVDRAVARGRVDMAFMQPVKCNRRGGHDDHERD
jgi:hypothetical protein